MTEDSASSYMMRMLIAGSTALLLCALFDYYQLQVWLYRKFETQACRSPLNPSDPVGSGAMRRARDLWQDQTEMYGTWWPADFTQNFLWEAPFSVDRP